MKKAILIIALLATYVSAFSQKKSKIDTTNQVQKAIKNPEFTVEPNKVYDIKLRLTIDEISLLTATPDFWKSIVNSSKLTGQQIQTLLSRADELRSTVFDQVKNVNMADYNKWQANQSIQKP